MMHNFRWNDLLNQIAIGRVVPIVGQGLVSIVDQGKDRLLYSLLAQRLAEQLGIDRTALPEDATISDVVIAYPHFREFPDEVYSMLYQLWTEIGVAVPETLLQLAEVGGFPLYLSTTFDTFLERALGQVLSLPEKAIDSVGYALNKRDDLRAEGLLAERPTVYHLFGRVSPSPEYAATDADLLEYVSFMQSSLTSPEKLFDYLKDKRLLLLGNGFPDWLSRFFFRTARNARLSDRRSHTVVVSDAIVVSDRKLKLFLDGFSHGTQIVENLTPRQFVQALHSAWKEKFPGEGRTPAAIRPEPRGRAAASAAFISYASEDRDAARKLKDFLEERNVTVWLDLEKLEAGDAYAEKIFRDIDQAKVFLPLVSKNTEASGTRFFRREWERAVRRLPSFFGTSLSFLMPVAIDGLSATAAENVPSEFKERQWTSAPGGMPPSGFADLLRTKIRDVVARERSAG